MGKHTDKLGKFEDFKAPWETATGTDAEIDSAKFKKYLYNLESDKAKALDAALEANDKVKTAEQAVKDAEDKLAEGDQSGELKKAQDALRAAEANAAEATEAFARLEVAVEKGLTPKQAKRLQGTTKEELEADADELLEDLGIDPKAGKPDGEEDEDGEPEEGRVTPRTRISLTNAGDPAPNSGKEIDYDAEAAKIVGGSLY